MDNSKILKKQIKLLTKQIKSLEKENKELKKKAKPKINVPISEPVTKEYVDAQIKPRLDVDALRRKAEERRKNIVGDKFVGVVPEAMQPNFYKVADIIAKDVETDKQKELLIDKCKLFDDIFNVFDKYIDEIVDVHVKLEKKGVSLGKAWDLSKSIRDNLKVKYHKGIDYNPDRLKAPQEQHLQVVSPNKNHPKFDPKKAEAVVDTFLKDNKLKKDVVTGSKNRDEFISVTLNGVEYMILKKDTYDLQYLKLVLKVPFDFDLKRCIKNDDKVEIIDLEQPIYLDTGTELISAQKFKDE